MSSENTKDWSFQTKHSILDKTKIDRLGSEQGGKKGIQSVSVYNVYLCSTVLSCSYLFKWNTTEKTLEYNCEV
jgi:hypothetical protein